MYLQDWKSCCPLLIYTRPFLGNCPGKSLGAGGVSPWGPVLTDRQQVSGRERGCSVGRYSEESLSAEVKGKRGIWGEQAEGGERWGGRRLSDRALPHNPRVLSKVTK